MEFLHLDIIDIALLIFVILCGTFVGMFAGSLPGIGAMVAIVILLPLTYNMEPLFAILLLLATYQAAEYGGSISSITLGIPGTPAATATLMDGTPLARSNSPGKALAYSLTASTMGGVFGAVILTTLAAPMASFALQLSAPEFALIGLLGLAGVGALSSQDITKSLISVVLGLMAATIGMDDFTGALRFTEGFNGLIDGLNIIAVITGVFAISEILTMINKNLNKKRNVDREGKKVRLSLPEMTKTAKPMGIGSITGTIMGIIPGIGPGASSWFAYAIAKKSSKHKEQFGKGSPEGIAAPEAANNASVGGALLPLLTLGIPGSAATAVILGAFVIHGIQPGPEVITNEPALTYGIFVGFFLTTVAMFITGKILTPWFARVLTIPASILVPVILMLSIIGVYTAQSSYFDVWVALILGLCAFFLIKLRFSIPSFVLAFILGPIIESNVRRSLIMSDGSYLIFVTRPYSLVILLMITALILITIITKLNRNKQETTSNSSGISS
ncbi:putative tricarboxylic transport membrane protein [Alteribacillus persepolensis]|uniref:Putative tricarboxylic transport membrane protein n=1 Tax=Alteribacillus persepolensis TaxID=568899 RepID=A0A1G8AYL0_9BACI|nr:tripartite tricarboxylate transporter permease [Alteribacillus persepolensis]SDH25460.1 putative tricarboxylic transport membrane protein [Alteribacillus persepolensis]